jgi:serine/threonine protein kinase
MNEQAKRRASAPDSVRSGSFDLGPSSGDNRAKIAEVADKLPVKVGDTIAGKYRLDALLAVGGMGAVFRAQHQQLGQAVAIKVLLPDVHDREKAIPRFLREARAAAGIQSEHVARTFDVDTLPDGTPYIVMELLEGQDLRAMGREVVKFTEDQVISVGLQVAEALAEAHAMNIVHRDLKPSNLFATRRRDGRLLIKLVDFGISKVTGPGSSTEVTLTDNRALIGSPAYMSPEQVRESRSVDHRSDIWSLGVILYQMLSAASPFRRQNVATTCAAVLGELPISLRELCPEVDPRLAEVVMRCLQKDPAHRFQSADELSRVLLAIEKNEPHLAFAQNARQLPAMSPVEPPVDPLLGFAATTPDLATDATALAPRSGALTAIATPEAKSERSGTPSMSGVQPTPASVLRDIEREVSAELGRLAVIGELRADRHEVRLLGSGVRVPLQSLTNEWEELPTADRRRRAEAVARQVAAAHKARTAPRHRPEDHATPWLLIIVVVVVLAAFGYGAFVWLTGSTP